VALSFATLELPAAQAQDAFVVGTPQSLTGPFAVIGRPMVAGANTYFKMINEKGGVNGKQLRLVALDDQLNADIGVAHARKLIAEGAVLLFAPISSGVSGALLPVLAESNVPMIAYTGVEALEADPNYFAVGLDTTQVLTVAANYIKSVAKTPPKIAFLTFESPASNTARDTIAKLVERWGWKIVAMETYRGGAPDYTSQALKIAAAQADYIIGSIIDGQAPQILNALQRAGNKATVVNFHAGSSEAVFKAIASDLFLAIRDVPAPNENGPALKSMREAAEKYGTTQDMISNVFTKGWLSAQLAVDALAACGNNCTSKAIRGHLENLKDFDTGGITPKLSFTKTKRIAIGSARVYQWNAKSGMAVPITEQISATAD
jgi:branched-chain amino acid transport system substrate-binding protein